MEDSETSKRQKEQLLASIKELVAYLDTQGLDRITVQDLRDAHWALDRMQVDGF
jgi:hypothetical protein